LHSLIHERDYDSIAVKEILDRANVGRSASYMHFRDKDELLVNALHDILGAMPSARSDPGANLYDRLLWFSLPVFEHLDHLRHAGELKLVRGDGQSCMDTCSDDIPGDDPAIWRLSNTSYGACYPTPEQRQTANSFWTQHHCLQMKWPLAREAHAVRWQEDTPNRRVNSSAFHWRSDS